MSKGVGPPLEDINPVESCLWTLIKGGQSWRVSREGQPLSLVQQETLISSHREHYCITTKQGTQSDICVVMFTVRYTMQCLVTHWQSRSLKMTRPDQMIQWVLLNMAEGVDSLRWKDGLNRLKKAQCIIFHFFSANLISPQLVQVGVVPLVENIIFATRSRRCTHWKRTW